MGKMGVVIVEGMACGAIDQRRGPCRNLGPTDKRSGRDTALAGHHKPQLFRKRFLHPGQTADQPVEKRQPGSRHGIRRNRLCWQFSNVQNRVHQV